MLYTIATVIVCTNLILYVSRQEPPNVTWFAFAAFLYGLAPALRADEWLMRNGNGKNGGNGGAGAPRS